MTIQLIIDSKFNSTGVKQAEQNLKQLTAGLEGLFQEAQGNLPTLNQLFDAFGEGDGGGIEDRVNRNVAALDRYSAALRKSAEDQFAMGNTAEALNLQNVANQVDGVANSFRRVREEEEQQGGILDFINNKFNKFAFSLFVVQGAINTVTRLIRQMSDALIEGASIADRSQAFNVLLEDAGVNAEAMRASLIKASQGAITLDAAMRPTLQLMKAGVPEVANMSGKLLEMAVASAKLSGDLSQTEQIYTTLVRGIVRGSPRLIDNADIYLKLGDANERYAESIGKTVEQLTAQEKIIATAFAVEEQGDQILELAEKVDSTAITFQSLKTDAEEAGQALLAATSVSVATAIEWFTDLVLTMGEATSAFYGFSEETQDSLRSFREALAENPFSTFAQSIIVGATAVSEILKFAINTIKEFGSALQAIAYLGLQVQKALTDVATGAITLEQAMERLAVAGDALGDTITDGLDASEEWDQAMANIDSRAREAAINIGLIAPEIDAVATAAEEASTRASAAFDEMSEGIKAAIQARTGPEAQFAKRREGIEEDLRDKIININEDLAEKLNDISAGLQERLVDLSTKYKDDIVSAQQETADELQKIDETLAEKLNDIAGDSSKDRQEAENKKNKGIEDAQEKHQKKLVDIERRYEAARLKALIDRDARALFEAEQNRRQGQEEASDDLADQIKEEQDQLKEKIEEINKLEEERRADAIKAAEKRRKDAQKALEDELRDLKDNYQKQKQEAIKSAAEQKQEAIKAAAERRRDAQEHYRDSLQDLDEWYREQLILQKERQLQQRISELEHLQEMGELTQAHLDELRGLWNDYNNSVSGATLPVTPQTATPGGGGGSIGGLTGGGGSTGGGNTIGGLTGGRSTTSPFGAGNFRLQINSNDKTLDEVLRSSTYDFMLEALEE